MRFMGLLFAAVTAALVMCGCGDSSLKYVPKDAEIVVYGNTKALFASKVWTVMEKNKTVKKELLDSVKEVLPVKKFEELSGNAVMWLSLDKKGNPQPGGMVICLDEGNAEDFFKMIKKNKEFVTEEEVDKCKALVVRVGEGKKDPIEFSVTMINDNMLHIVFGDEPKVFENGNDSDIASSLDASAVVAIGSKGEVFSSLAGEKDVEKIGISKVEAFLTGSEIKVSAIVDISDLDD